MSIRAVNKSLISLCVLAGLGLAAVPAMAHKAGEVLIRGRVINISPDVSSEGIRSNGTLVPNSQVDVEDAWTLEVDGTYMLTDNLGLELIADPSTKHNVVTNGTFYSTLGVAASGQTLIETRVLPPTLTLQYHFLPNEKFQPYVGLGINYTLFFKEEANAAFNSLATVTDLSLDDSFGLSAQAGFDFDLDNGWFVNADLKYIQINTTASFNTVPFGRVTADVDIDPWVFGVGIGKSFSF